MTDVTNVGVVVIGRNEGERLIACLMSLAQYALPTVYVDSASTDGSRDAALAAGATVLALDLAKPFTAARARAEGVDALLATHPNCAFVQFVDGDCLVCPEWIALAQGFLSEHADYAVACGRRRERYPDVSIYNRMADIEWATPVGDAAACGGDSLVRVSAYLSVGGFDERLIAGEEPELCSRLRADGWRVRRIDADMTLHDAAMTRLAQWWRRAVRSGFGYAQAWRATRSADQPLYKRELVRAFAWTLGPVGIAVFAASLLQLCWLLLAPALWLGQTARLATRFRRDGHSPWERAFLLTLGKIAEAWGATKFAGRAMSGATGGTIFYK